MRKITSVRYITYNGMALRYVLPIVLLKINAVYTEEKVGAII